MNTHSLPRRQAGSPASRKADTDRRPRARGLTCLWSDGSSRDTEGQAAEAAPDVEAGL